MRATEEMTEAAGRADPGRTGRRAEPGQLLFLLAVAVIVILGLGLRLGDWQAVTQQRVQLGPDAREYLTIARQMKHFYWPSYREPLHPALIRVATWLVGPGQKAPRLVSFTFSNLLVLVAALVGWRLYGRWPALAASAFVALHPYWLYASTEGLRLELYSTLLLGFVWLTAEPAQRGRRLRLILAGLLGGLLGLVRMTSLAFVVPVLGWFLVRPGPRGPGQQAGVAAGLRPAALVAGALLVLVIAPYLYVSHRDLGDALIWINRHAAWWQYRELRQGAPAPAAPERSAPAPPAAAAGRQAEGPAAAGRPARVTVWGYLLGRRSVGALVGRMLRGYGKVGWVLGRIFATEWLYGVTVRVGWLGFVGLVGLLWRGPRLPVVTAVLSLLPVSFVVPLGANPRLYLHVLPLWIMWWAWGLAWPVGALWAARRAPDRS